MSLSYDVELKNKLLNGSFRNADLGLDKEVYLHVNSVDGAPEHAYTFGVTTFKPAANGSIEVNPVMITVPGPSYIDKIWITDGATLQNIIAVVELEGEEIQDFTSAGTFTVQNLKINIY